MSTITHTNTCISTTAFAPAGPSFTSTAVRASRTDQSGSPTLPVRALAAVRAVLRAALPSPGDTPTHRALDDVDDLLARHRPHR